jgi:hypothetical protein
VRRLAVLGVALAACEKAGDGRKTLEIAPPKLTITLVDAGAAPRAPLRLHFKAGATKTYERTIDQTVHRGSRVDHEAPHRMRLEERVVTVEPDGHFQQHSRFRDVELETRHDARGRLESMTQKAPPGSEPPSSGYAYEYTIVFPDEPVGPGARWRFVAETTADHASVDVSMISVQDDEVELRASYVATHKRAREQEIDSVGTADWHLDLAGPQSTMHAQERVTLAADSATWVERTVDLVPVAP